MTIYQNIYVLSFIVMSHYNISVQCPIQPLPTKMPYTTFAQQTPSYITGRPILRPETPGCELVYLVWSGSASFMVLGMWVHHGVSCLRLMRSVVTDNKIC